MTRAYTAEPVDSVVVDEILDLARRGPSAGKTDSLQFLVLGGADVARYWDTTLPVGTRSSFPWPQLLDAPVLVIPWVEPGAYVVATARPTRRAPGWATAKTPGRCRTGGSTGVQRP